MTLERERREPATEAGRRLAERLGWTSGETLGPIADILAIEAQVTDARVAALEEALRHARLVLVAEDADTLFFGRDDFGNKLTFEWGEPDQHGWYTPTITAHYDDNIVAAAVREAALSSTEPSDGEGIVQRSHVACSHCWCGEHHEEGR